MGKKKEQHSNGLRVKLGYPKRPDLQTSKKASEKSRWMKGEVRSQPHMSVQQLPSRSVTRAGARGMLVKREYVEPGLVWTCLNLGGQFREASQPGTLRLHIVLNHLMWLLPTNKQPVIVWTPCAGTAEWELTCQFFTTVRREAWGYACRLQRAKY